jgi:hypothetical protein
MGAGCEDHDTTLADILTNLAPVGCNDENGMVMPEHSYKGYAD